MSFPLGFKQAAPGIVDRRKMLLSMSLVLLSFKLFLIHSYASQCPFWDQWGAEGARMYAPYLNGELKPNVLFRFHNEHLILFTRISSLLLFEVMGRWDTLAEMIFNSLVHVAALAVFVHYVTRSLTDNLFVFSVLLFTPFLLIPVGWENLLWGFQSQFYFCILCSLVCLDICLEARSFSKEWFAGVFIGLCAFTNIASGAIVFAVLFFFSLVRLLVSGDRKLLYSAECLIHLVILVLLFAVTPQLERHKELQALSIGQFIEACSVILSWPFRENRWYGLVMWSPTGLLALKLIGKGMPRADRSVLVLAISAWVLATGFVLAYGRANALLPSRYLDVILLGVLTNSAAALILLENMGSGGKRWIASIATFGFFFFIGLLSDDVFRSSMDGIRWRHEIGKRNEENVTYFIDKGEMSFPEGNKPFEIPFPNSIKLAKWLADPMVRGMLPPEFGSTPRERKMVRERTILKGCISGFATNVRDSLLTTSPLLVVVSASWFLWLLIPYFRGRWHP